MCDKRNVLENKSYYKIQTYLRRKNDSLIWFHCTYNDIKLNKYKIHINLYI